MFSPALEPFGANYLYYNDLWMNFTMLTNKVFPTLTFLSTESKQVDLS